MASPETRPAPGHRAAQGIALALVLSAPVWLGIGVAIWQFTTP